MGTAGGRCIVIELLAKTKDSFYLSLIYHASKNILSTTTRNMI